MRRLRDYRNHTSRARRLAWLLDRSSAPLSWLHRPAPPPPPGGDERILLLRADHLGDVLMATPAIAALRAARPDARIEVLASPWGAPALEENPHVDQVRTFPATWYESARAGTLQLGDITGTLRELLAGSFDVGVDLRGDPRMIAMMWAAGIRSRVGLGAIGLETVLGASVPLDPSWDHRRRNLEVMALLGADAASAPERPIFTVSPQDREEGERLLAGVPRPWIVVAPGSTRRRNTWGAARFAAAAALLAATTKGSVALVGRDADAWATKEVRDALPDAVDLTARTTLAQLAGLLAGADLLLANDSGALHVAVAAGCPVVGVFGPSDPALTFPYPASAGVALAGPTPCRRPCFRRDCQEDHGYAALDPDRVVEAALPLMQRKRSGVDG
jgi:ADP-heptose:LPS heptosyltransferase